MKKQLALMTTLALGSTALALPIQNNTLSGQITDWPGGKPGELQLRLLDVATSHPEVVVASTAIDAQGKFTFKLPNAAALVKVLPAKDSTYSFEGDCTGSVTLSPTAQINFFDLIASQGGKVVSNAKFRTSRTPWLGTGDRVQQLVYASAATTADGAASCSVSNSAFTSSTSGRLRLEITAPLASGWNVLAGEVKGGTKVVYSADPMPKNAFWHVLIGYGGIGLRPALTDDGKGVQVKEVMAGGAAEAAGIKPGDILLAIDDVPLTSTDLAALGERVRGEENTTVTLTVKRGTETLKFPLKRLFVRLN